MNVFILLHVTMKPMQLRPVPCNVRRASIKRSYTLSIAALRSLRTSQRRSLSEKAHHVWESSAKQYWTVSELLVREGISRRNECFVLFTAILLVNCLKFVWWSSDWIQKERSLEKLVIQISDEFCYASVQLILNEQKKIVFFHDNVTVLWSHHIGNIRKKKMFCFRPDVTLFNEPDPSAISYRRCKEVF